MQQSTPHAIKDIRTLLHYFLYEYDSMRLVAPSDDPQYSAWLRERSQNLGAYNQLSKLLGPTVALCAVLCLLRIAFFRCVALYLQPDVSGRRAATARASSSEEVMGVAEPPAPGISIGPAAGHISTKRTAEGEAVAVDSTLRLGEGLWTLGGASVSLTHVAERGKGPREYGSTGGCRRLINKPQSRDPFVRGHLATPSLVDWL
ncbi:hypothetical protein Vretimale_3753 [Volvox reticuliferus]|uniref:Uncharacterized protein n=1 Tax=Volvox reticuliferus TaxID=1737510 RepID=A0A8J4DEB3_9CHLO|nr:hypothetical protein Vretimale_3753 [Volvox reticuliferus]